MKKLNMLAGLMCFTALSSISVAAYAQHFTNPVMNPSTRETSTSHSREPIPKGTNVGNGWVTTGGSTARDTPMPSGGRGIGGGSGGSGSGGGGGAGGGGWGGSNGVRSSSSGGGGCAQNACFDDDPGRDY
jgi:hypothetical protein